MLRINLSRAKVDSNNFSWARAISSVITQIELKYVCALRSSWSFSIENFESRSSWSLSMDNFESNVIFYYLFWVKHCFFVSRGLCVGTQWMIRYEKFAIRGLAAIVTIVAVMVKMKYASHNFLTCLRFL